MSAIIEVVPKKKPKTGRVQDVMKMLRLSSHETGDSCQCKRLKCFEVTTDVERKAILMKFNRLESYNEQSSYLCGLIAVIPVQRRRGRKPELEATYHQSSFAYKIRVVRGDSTEEVSVCAKAFINIHGITKGKLEHLQKALKSKGVAPKDMRGKHCVTSNKLSDDLYNKIVTHIQSFKGRQSHYSLKDSKKLYLSEDLNVRKMFLMFKQLHPDETVSYEKYRLIFNGKFNISFGYPRTDTCSTCDRYIAEIRRLKLQSNSETEIRQLDIQNELHRRKAQCFYDRKREAKKKGKITRNFTAIAMDFQRNVSLPNVPTNDVYYSRQLSMYSFNIHMLSSGMAVFYSYPEHVARKGADEVCSFLFDFIMNHLENDVTNLHIFCDSAGGQNKNFTMFRFMHFMVHDVKRLDCIKITFPVRGTLTWSVTRIWD